MDGISRIYSLEWVFQICDEIHQMTKEQENANRPIDRNDPQVKRMIALFKEKQQQSEERKIWNMAKKFWEDVESGKIGF
ncbi:MAG: hypothetical protein JSR80_00185 [Verrucomicrobia bacterium]|nr:hypothetical protein [Verrucomicrobiota bacterium]